MPYLLDTSFPITSVLGKPRAEVPRSLYLQHLAVSFITLRELCEGAFHHTNPFLTLFLILIITSPRVAARNP